MRICRIIIEFWKIYINKKVLDDLQIILILLIERLRKPIGEGVNNDKIN